MLSDKNDNKFLNALNDIDDDLVEEIMEMPVEPKIVSQPPTKSRFMRFAVPAAASLAIIAVVGIGALIFGNNLLSPTGGNTEATESEPASNDTEQLEAQTDPVIGSADTAPSQSSAEETTGLSSTPPINTGVSRPRPLNEVDIPNLNGYSVNFDVPNDGILQSVIFDTKKYGDYEVSLIGNGVFTDFDNASEDIILAHSLDVYLYKNGELIDFRKAYNPLDPDASVFMLMKDHLDSYLELGGAANEQNTDTGDFLIIFRSLNGTGPIPEVLFYFVSEGKLFGCKREDLGDHEDRAERSEALSPDITAAVANGVYTVYDNLTGVKFTFEMINSQWCSYMEGRSNFPWYKDGINPTFDPDSLTVMDDFFTYDEAKEIRTKLSAPTVISKTDVGDYTLCFTGTNMWKSSSGTIYFYNPQTIVTKDNEYICSVNNTLPEMVSCHASMMYSNNGNYDGYAAGACIMDDVLLIIDKGNINNSYFGSYDCFYAYNGDGDYTYRLTGYYPDMPGTDPPAWTEGKKGYDLIIDAENKRVIYGFMQFEFNFEALPAMSNYTVSWLQNPIKLNNSTSDEETAFLANAEQLINSVEQIGELKLLLMEIEGVTDVQVYNSSDDSQNIEHQITEGKAAKGTIVKVFYDNGKSWAEYTKQ